VYINAKWFVFNNIIQESIAIYLLFTNRITISFATLHKCIYNLNHICLANSALFTNCIDYATRQLLPLVAPTACCYLPCVHPSTRPSANLASIIIANIYLCTISTRELTHFDDEEETLTNARRNDDLLLYSSCLWLLKLVVRTLSVYHKILLLLIYFFVKFFSWMMRKFSIY